MGAPNVTTVSTPGVNTSGQPSTQVPLLVSPGTSFNNVATYSTDANGNVTLTDPSGYPRQVPFAPNSLKPISNIGTYKFFGGTATGDTAGGNGAGSANFYTYLLKFEVEASFDAIQLVWENHVTASPIQGVKFAVASTETADVSTQNNLSVPTYLGATNNTSTLTATGAYPFGWTLGTFNGQSTGVVPAGQSTLIQGQLESDWMPCQSLPRADGGIRPLVMLRAYVGSTNNYSFIANTGLAGMRSADAISNRRILQLSTFNGDGVGTLASTFSLAVTSPLVYVRVRHRNGVITVVAIGDSITQNDALVYDSLSNWLKRACNAISTPALPVIPMNLGWSSQTSATYQRNSTTTQFIPATPQTITTPASGVSWYNTTKRPLNVLVSGGTVTVISVNTVATGATFGSFILQPGENINITWSVSPTVSIVQSFTPQCSPSNPDIAIYAPFSPNDSTVPTSATTAALLARMEDFFDYCSQNQCYRMIWTPVPNSAGTFTAAADVVRQKMITDLRAITKIPVVDIAAATGANAGVYNSGASPEQWKPGYTNVPGWQYVLLGTIATSATVTNYVGATTYTATITIDGTACAISFLGSSAATYGAFLTTLNAQINTGMGTTNLVYAFFNGGSIVVTSLTQTSSSTVAITAGTAFSAPLNSFSSIATASAPITTGVHPNETTIANVIAPAFVTALNALIP